MWHLTESWFCNPKTMYSLLSTPVMCIVILCGLYLYFCFVLFWSILKYQKDDYTFTRPPFHTAFSLRELPKLVDAEQDSNEPFSRCTSPPPPSFCWSILSCSQARLTTLNQTKVAPPFSSSLQASARRRLLLAVNPKSETCRGPYSELPGSLNWKCVRLRNALQYTRVVCEGFV